MNARPVFQGELGLLSLFDLAQLLMLNGASGTLLVESGTRKGQLRFERGQIANAEDERLVEGVEAAFHIFTWRTGTFEFRVGPPHGRRTIHESTEGLMLEAAQRLDEAGAAAGDASVTQAVAHRLAEVRALRVGTGVVAPASAGLRAMSREDSRVLADVLDRTAGLVLVGAPGIRAAQELLRAVVAQHLARRSARGVLAAEREGWSEFDATLTRTSRERIAEALVALTPELAVFDVAHAAASLAALPRVPLVLCAVVAPDAASVPARWLARHESTSTDSPIAPWAGTDVGVLFTPTTRADGGPLPVIAAHASVGTAAGPREVDGAPRDLRDAA